MKGRKRKQSIGLTSFYVQFKKKKEETKQQQTNKQQQQQKLSIKTGATIVLQTIF